MVFDICDKSPRGHDSAADISCGRYQYSGLEKITTQISDFLIMRGGKVESLLWQEDINRAYAENPYAIDGKSCLISA